MITINRAAGVISAALLAVGCHAVLPQSGTFRMCGALQQGSYLPADLELRIAR